LIYLIKHGDVPYVKLPEGNHQTHGGWASEILHHLMVSTIPGGAGFRWPNKQNVW